MEICYGFYFCRLLQELERRSSSVRIIEESAEELLGRKKITIFLSLFLLGAGDHTRGSGVRPTLCRFHGRLLPPEERQPHGHQGDPGSVAPCESGEKSNE